MRSCRSSQPVPIARFYVAHAVRVGPTAALTALPRPGQLRSYDPPRLPDPELHLPRRRPGRAVRRRRRTGPRGRRLGLRHGAGDGPLLPTADARRPRPVHARVLQPARRPGPRDVDGPAECAGHGQHVPQSGGAGEDRDDPRHRLERPCPARDRRRMVRAGTRFVRHRVRHLHRSLREAGGGACRS